MKNKWTMQPAEFLRPYDLVLKTEKLENVRVVMITSHHTILYSDLATADGVLATPWYLFGIFRRHQFHRASRNYSTREPARKIGRAHV